jgi:hypothetical protein
MTDVPVDASLRRRLQLGTVGLGVVVAALSTVAVSNLDVLTGTSRRAVEATAAAYGTTPAVAFVTLHSPLLFGVVAGALGPLYVGLLLPGGVGSPGEAAADPGTLGRAIRFYATAGMAATVVALGVPLAVGGAGVLPLGLLLAFVTGLPLGVLALCGATVGTALEGARGWRSARLLGTLGPVAGLVLAHAAPTGPVWMITAGASFLAAALAGGGWTLVSAPE